jgi:hypothetical protein
MLHLLSFLQWNMVLTKAEGFSMMRYILAAMTMFSYIIFLIIFKFGFAGLAASLDEQQNATSLLAQIEKIGSSVSLRGMAKE